MKKVKIWPVLLYGAIVLLLLLWVTGVFSQGGSDLPYSEVIVQFQEKNVKEFVLQGNTLTMELNTAYQGTSRVEAHIADPESFIAQIQPMLDETVAYDWQKGRETSPYDYIVPIVLAGAVLLIIWMFLASRANQSHPMSNFGKAGVIDGSRSKVTFQDVAGMSEEKQELQEVVEFLVNPDKFKNLGAKIPHGILLSGPPGTGKTLLARAVAGEAGVPFLAISGSDFMELYVGVGASRVRDLFEQARKMAPSIIFIDEIDAVGRKRGSGMGGGHDEREQTLNQLLVELDGFAKFDGVVVLAATNRVDILDPALLRPGRFDRQVYVGMPDASEREEILRVHARGKRLDDSVNLHTLALSTAGFTGADLSNLLNEGAILAARENKPALSMQHLSEAMMKVVAGPEKRSRVKLQKDLYMTAVHEAGHAVAMYHLPTHDPVRYISIIPRGKTLGTTWSQPEQESTHLTRREMYEDIVALLAGRAAEELFLQDISTGASNDIDRASKLARDMVARYGMNKALGTISYTGGEELFIGRDFERTKGYSEKTAGTIDDEVKLLMDKAYEACRSLLQREEAKLKAVVAFLMEKETMTASQFRACMAGEPIPDSRDENLFTDFQ